MHVIRLLQEHFYVTSNFCYVNNVRHRVTSFLRNLFRRPSCLYPTATRTTHLWVTTSFLSLNSKHNFCYVYSEAYPSQTTSHFNSAYIFWRPLFQNLLDYQLLATCQKPAQLFYTCFPSHYADQHKRLPFNSSFIKLLKLKTFSFFSFIFLLI